jgi:hypothetical protein
MTEYTIPSLPSPASPWLVLFAQSPGLSPKVLFYFDSMNMLYHGIITLALTRIAMAIAAPQQTLVTGISLII